MKTIACFLLVLSVASQTVAAEEPRFYSNELYRANFGVGKDACSVTLDIGGRKFLLGHRVDTWSAKTSASAGKLRSHSFEKLPDGLKFTYENDFTVRNTNRLMGVVRQTFTCHPAQVVYNLTITPEGSWDFGSASGSFLRSLVWPLDTKAFEGLAVKKTAANGTSVMNLIDYSEGAFGKDWMPGIDRTVRVEFANAHESIVLTPSGTGAALTFGRYGGKNGTTLELDFWFDKPADSGWSYTFDKPISMTLTFDITRWNKE